MVVLAVASLIFFFLVDAYPVKVDIHSFFVFCIVYMSCLFSFRGNLV